MAVKEKQSTLPIPEQMLASIFQSFTEPEIEALRARVLDCALGVRLAVLTPRKSGRTGEEYEGERTDQDGEVWHVYTRPPDSVMLSLLFSHAVGRPGQRRQVQVDPIVEVRHFVPGFTTVPTKAQEIAMNGGSPERVEAEEVTSGRAMLQQLKDDLLRERSRLDDDDFDDDILDDVGVDD